MASAWYVEPRSERRALEVEKIRRTPTETLLPQPQTIPATSLIVQHSILIAGPTIMVLYRQPPLFFLLPGRMSICTEIFKTAPSLNIHIHLCELRSIRREKPPAASMIG